MTIVTSLNVGTGVAGQYLIHAGVCHLKKIIVWAPQGGDYPIIYDAASTATASASNTLAQIIPVPGGGVNYFFNILNWPMANGIVVELTTVAALSPMQISLEYEV